jgi:hypothetical protein
MCAGDQHVMSCFHEIESLKNIILTFDLMIVLVTKIFFDF